MTRALLGIPTSSVVHHESRPIPWLITTISLITNAGEGVSDVSPPSEGAGVPGAYSRAEVAVRMLQRYSASAVVNSGESAHPENYRRNIRTTRLHKTSADPNGLSGVCMGVRFTDCASG